MNNTDKIEDLLKRLFSNKQFIEDAKKEFDYKNVEHNPLTENDKKHIISYINNTI